MLTMLRMLSDESVDERLTIKDMSYLLTSPFDLLIVINASSRFLSVWMCLFHSGHLCCHGNDPCMYQGQQR